MFRIVPNGSPQHTIIIWHCELGHFHARVCVQICSTSTNKRLRGIQITWILTGISILVKANRAFHFVSMSNGMRMEFQCFKCFSWTGFVSQLFSSIWIWSDAYPHFPVKLKLNKSKAFPVLALPVWYSVGLFAICFKKTWPRKRIWSNRQQ